VMAQFEESLGFDLELSYHTELSKRGCTLILNAEQSATQPVLSRFLHFLTSR
jgi:hypothetical protein